MHHPPIALILALLGLLCLGKAPADEIVTDPEPSTTQQPKTSPKGAEGSANLGRAADPLALSAKVAHSRPRDIYDAVTIFVELVNQADETLTIDQLYLQVDDELLRTRATVQQSPSVNTNALADKENLDGINVLKGGSWAGRRKADPLTLESGKSLRLTMRIPSAGGDRIPNEFNIGHYLYDLRNVYLLTFSPQTFDVNIVAEYSMENGDHKRRGTSVATVGIPFVATWAALMIGGGLGCVLVSLLQIGNRWVNLPRIDKGPAYWRSLGHECLGIFGSELLWLCVGIPAVVIVVVLLLRLDASSFPISFKVSDFTGGLLLGLFSRTLVKPLLEKLFPPVSPLPQPADNSRDANASHTTGDVTNSGNATSVSLTPLAIKTLSTTPMVEPPKRLQKRASPKPIDPDPPSSLNEGSST